MSKPKRDYAAEYDTAIQTADYWRDRYLEALARYDQSGRTTWDQAAWSSVWAAQRELEDAERALTVARRAMLRTRSKRA